MEVVDVEKPKVEGVPGVDDVEFAEIFEKLKAVVGQKEINHSTIVVIVIDLIREMTEYSHLPGNLKKACVLKTLEEIIKMNVHNPELESSLLFMVRLTVPDMIDTFIGLDKKKMKIYVKSFVETLKDWVKPCCSANVKKVE